MSRRYGRNQKREAREAITALQAEAQRWERAYSLADGLCKVLTAEKVELRGRLERVVASLGPNFIGLPADLAAYRATNEDRARGLFRATTPYGGVVSMHMLRMDFRPDSVTGRVHIRVQLANGEVAYALSGQAILETPAEILGEYLANEIAPALVKSCREHGAPL